MYVKGKKRSKERWLLYIPCCSTNKETCFVLLTFWVSVSIGNRGDDCNSRNQTRFPDLGELDHSAAAFHHDDAFDSSPSMLSFYIYININMGFPPFFLTTLWDFKPL